MSLHLAYVAQCVQVYPLGGQMHVVIWDLLHTAPMYMLAANVLFRIPLWRHYMSVGSPLS
jgi:hypothetical protein